MSRPLLKVQIGMLEISLNDFLELNDVRFININKSAFEQKHIKGISIDSRTINPGEVYWALQGERFDGHDFISEVHKKAAFCSVISAKGYQKLQGTSLPLIVVEDTLLALQELATLYRNKFEIPVIGLTGSNGKTTTKEMLANILQQRHTVHKTRGNFNNQIGCPLTVFELTSQDEYAVFELGTSHFGEIEILTDIVKPNYALITLIGDTHLELLKNRAGVAKEKFNLFDGLEAGSTIFINNDDPFISKYENPQLNRRTYAFELDADVRGGFGPVDAQGCGTLIINETHQIKLNVPGLHNVRNALAAATVAKELGCYWEEIKAGLESFKGVDKRMQVIKWKETTIINDAYNANPGSVKLAIQTVKQIDKAGKLVLALGDMNELGTHSAQMHVDILKFARENQPDMILTVGAKMNAAAEELADGIVKACNNLEELANTIEQIVKPGDVLLLKASRGIQLEKVMGLLS